LAEQTANLVKNSHTILQLQKIIFIESHLIWMVE